MRKRGRKAKHRNLSDVCRCGHTYGNHAARAPFKCLQGYVSPWWMNTPDMITCETKCQAFADDHPARGRGK